MKKMLAVLSYLILAICISFPSSAAEYPMIEDTVQGANIETFVIERPNPKALGNNTVNASEFGLSTANEDNYKAFSDALVYCGNHPNTYLVIDKGVYYFKTNATLELTGLQNVLIEGNGAEFIFETQKQFGFDSCNGVELRDLIVDWNWEKNRVASLVQVQNKTDNSFEIKFLELDEVDEDIPIVSFQQYDTKDHVPGAYGSWKTFNPVEVPGSVVNVEKIEPNVLRIDFSSKFTTSFHNEEVYILRHYTYGGAVFNVHGGSSNITFDNVRIYGSAGMGFVFGEKANHFQIINSYIGLRPGNEDKQRMSTTADGIHILNTDGYFRIDNCDLSYTGDDIINIHDDMLKITQCSKNQIVGIVTGGFVKKGDTIRIYNRNVEDIGFETEVTGFIRQSDGATLTLKDELPAEVTAGFFVYRSSSSTHNYVITNNYIHETKGRAALLNAADALYENNTMYRTVSECVQVRVDLADRNDKIWYEGIGARNVVINHNVFEECSFGGKSSIITIDCNMGVNKNVLSDVHITNNEFYYCNGELITADNVTNLFIENNLISDCGEIRISNDCGAVYNNGNTISYPSKTCPHTDTKQVLDRQPGCFEYGSTGKTYCNQCHTIIDENYRGIPPLKHKGLQVSRIDVPPTCTESGLSSMVCSLCKTVVETGIIEPATGHNSNGVGGSCSVCGYGGQVVVSGMSLELDTETVDYIGVNLYIDAPEGTVFYLDGKSIEAAKVKNSGLYKLQYKCAPKEFADMHVLRAMDKENQSLTINKSAEYTYSGDMYCRLVSSGGNDYSDQLKNVCESLLIYSEHAREYFGYNTEGLTVGNVAAKLPTTDCVMKTTGVLPDGCAYLGSSLLLGDELVLRHYFMGDVSGYTITCTNAESGKSIPVAVGSKETGTATYVDIKVAYSEIGEMFDLKVEAVSNSNPYTLSYGALTYCREAQENNSDSKLTNLCNALYNFSSALAKMQGE